jgi:hypothetical protein
MLPKGMSADSKEYGFIMEEKSNWSLELTSADAEPFNDGPEVSLS